MLELSIVLPTCNRAALLEQSLRSIETGVRCEHEIIVVDGASSDATPDVLNDASKRMGDRLRVIREEKREGFVRGTNKGFRSARGKNMTWLNDDARPLPGALDTAIETLNEQSPDVAFVAMFHHWNSAWNIAYQAEHEGKKYQLCHIRGTFYANFPMGRRATYERLGFFDERFYVCAADPDLSLKAWFVGLSIVPAWGSVIEHDILEDDRRAGDSQFGKEDNRKLFAKWDLPAKNPHVNDFDPQHPCTLRSLRQTRRVA
jgi:GT2 family glycosyltransferase